MDPVDQHDRVAGLQPDYAEAAAVVSVQLDVDDASLHDEHLLQVLDSTLEGLVVVRRLLVTRLVCEQPELERGLRRGEEHRLLHLQVRANDLSVGSALVLDDLYTHRRRG